jgi:hypothetical protein
MSGANVVFTFYNFQKLPLALRERDRGEGVATK